ncbi:MAG: hypothetical protein AAF485_15730 [Chloroflexota bacterium]
MGGSSYGVEVESSNDALSDSSREDDNQWDTTLLGEMDPDSKKASRRNNPSQDGSWVAVGLVILVIFILFLLIFILSI